MQAYFSAFQLLCRENFKTEDDFVEPIAYRFNKVILSFEKRVVMRVWHVIGMFIFGALLYLT